MSDAASGRGVVGRLAAPPPVRARRRRGRAEAADGMVVAEAAVAIPVLLVLTVILVWVVSLAATSLSLADAVRQAARDIARGVPTAGALAAAQSRAPDAILRADGTGGTVRVVAEQQVRAPVLSEISVGLRQDVVVPMESP